LGVVRLRVIAGPTAAGKSALAMALAARVGAAIVSADSRQVYRGFDIGTAKATPDERARVPHYGVDLVEPTQRYSAADWAAAAGRWLGELSASGRPALLVGGTGFYLRALVDPLFAAPSLDAPARASLAGVLEPLPIDELRRWCRALDPERAHLGRTQLLRAVETALLTGERLSALHRSAPRAATAAARYLVVDPGRALAHRIETRLDAMLGAGWESEVRRLVQHVPEDAPAWSATGYDALRDVVRGARTLESARSDIVIATRQYAKRQRTWFRHQLGGAPVVMLDPTMPDALERATRWWMEEES
jgi:tRNA dimethylallyltransferase